MADKKDSTEFNIFETEEKVINDVESFLKRSLQEIEKRSNSQEEVLYKKIIEVVKEYKKLFKTTKRIMKMSDRRESEVRKLNSQMNEKNELLDILTSKLSRYISPQLAETIYSGTQDVTLKSTRKKLTVFFSDIIGFSDLADELESEDLTELLNYYMNEMTKVALEHGATVDKYIGDSIMIFFGDPTSLGVKEDALRCLEMAVAMKNKLAELRKNESGKFHKFYSTRIGIHTGYCTVGNFGSENRMDYTVIGNSVNIASRLESSAGANEIFISEDTYNLVKETFFCEQVGQIKLKGLSHPMSTYKVIDLHTNMEEHRKIFQTNLHNGNSSIFINSNKLNKDEIEESINEIEKILSQLKKEI